MRWHKLPKDEFHRAEAYLKAREVYCVSAAARFLSMKEKRDHVWFMPGPAAGISALLLHSRQSLYPVFGASESVPGPGFLNRFLGKVHIHALQGLAKDAEILETLMENQGYYSAERIDYALMNLDGRPRGESLKAGPADLVLRPPAPEDENSLFELQAAYEKEEVLPKTDRKSVV